ncbi:MAG: TrkA C-terminal domain-containing protein, partial [Hymenobacteraceae bacterium]|nr:TrkA C-terminal domain-containing protein [Hymenobacteraceae bacterium]
NEAFKIASLELPDFEIATLRVQQSDNDIIGKTLEEANVRQLYKVTLVAIRRGSSLLDEMSAETRIQQDDLLYVIGKPHDVAAFHKMLKTT